GEDAQPERRADQRMTQTRHETTRAGAENQGDDWKKDERYQQGSGNAGGRLPSQVATASATRRRDHGRFPASSVGGRRPSSPRPIRPAEEVNSSIHAAASSGWRQPFTTAIGYSARTLSSGGIGTAAMAVRALAISVRYTTPASAPPTSTLASTWRTFSSVDAMRASTSR